MSTPNTGRLVLSIPGRRFVAIVALLSGMMFCNAWSGAWATQAIWQGLSSSAQFFRVVWLAVLGAAVAAGSIGFYRSLMRQSLARGPLTVFAILCLPSFGAGGATLNVLPFALSFGLNISDGAVSLNLLGLAVLFWYGRVRNASDQPVTALEGRPDAGAATQDQL